MGVLGPRSVLALYAATIFLSALLLFAVQPMLAKMVLPVLGGAPSIWAVSLCFFQSLLLAGYLYAHMLNSRLNTGAALAVHMCVLLAALAVLPVAIPAPWSAPPPGAGYGWLLGLLTASIALPFLALSAHAPLLQAWFARAASGPGPDPYGLYVASNTGSLAALLAYPFVVEPLLALRAQSVLWTAAYVVLAGLIAACGVQGLARHAAPQPLVPPAPSVTAAPAAGTRWRQRAAWAALAFVPSGLLVALTTYLTTDLASAPLLWVIPLALYLVTFIVAFRARATGQRAFLLAQPAAVAAVLVAGEWSGGLGWALASGAGLIAFTLTGLVCHRALYERRPEPARLTEFYLYMSLGGALGGMFAALLAPVLFTNVLEFPLFLALGMLCRPDLWRALATSRDRIGLAASLAAAVGLILILRLLIGHGLIPQSDDLRLAIFCALGLALVAAFYWPRIETAIAIALAVAVMILPLASAPVYVTRSFFGTHRVVDTAGGAYRLLLHGTTLHGLQRNPAPADPPGLRPSPLGYYHPTGPMARGVQLARLAHGGLRRPLRIGVVGLGTGALACHGIPGDRWRYFEIDPAVAHIATTPAYFRFLPVCLPGADIVLGDARLTLAKEQAQAFDYLLIDAFSSDAIPVHLLTVEALRLYASLLSDRGVLALHISNQNLDLPPIIEANLAQFPELKGIYAEGERGSGALASQVVLIARHDDILAPALGFYKARRLDSTAVVRPWTDDYSDLLSAIIRRLHIKLDAASVGSSLK